MIKIYNLNSTSELSETIDIFNEIDHKDVFNDPIYVRILANEYGYTPLVIYYENNGDYVYYPFFLRNIGSLPFANQDYVDINIEKYWDIISSWYYGGPIYSREDKSLLYEFRKEFEKYCIANKVVAEFIRFNPNLGNHKELKDYIKITNVGPTIFIDLSNDINDIWKQYEKRNRNIIRKARKFDIVVKISKNDTRILKKFYTVYIKEMYRKADRDHYFLSFRFFEELSKSIPKNVFLSCAFLDKEFIGASMCIYGYGISYDYLMASYPQYWKTGVNNLILHETIIHAKKEGNKIYDLMGGRESVFRFKKAFSPHRNKFFIGKKIYMDDIYLKLVKYREMYRDPRYEDFDKESKFFPLYADFKIKR